jgi:replicative DNA helicase
MTNLPHSVDFERYLLGAIIRDNGTIPEGLRIKDFFEPKHQEIAEAILILKEQGRQIDELTVTEFLRVNKSVVPVTYVSTTVTEIGFTNYNPDWATEIRRTSALREIIANAAEVQRLATEQQYDPASLIAYAEGNLNQIIDRSKPKDGPQIMSMESMMNFDRKNDPECVIGNRWLCKGGSLLLVSQSGVGKSSFALQFLVSLCINRPFFGIKAKRPLRIVMTQAENNLGDVAEAMQDITSGMNLYQSDYDVLRDNLFIYRDTNSVGQAFLDQMRKLIELHHADVILVDPLLSFAGIEVADQKQMTEFLRHGVAKILEETGCILVAVHHTTKPKSAKDKEGQTPSDLAYSGAGASELVNYVREVGVLVRQSGDDPVFKFSLTKRRGRAGMQDANGNFAGDIVVRHARNAGQIRWEYGEITQPAQEPTLRVDSGHSDSRSVKGSPSRFNR